MRFLKVVNTEGDKEAIELTFLPEGTRTYLNTNNTSTSTIDISEAINLFEDNLLDSVFNSEVISFLENRIYMLNSVVWYAKQARKVVTGDRDPISIAISENRMRIADKILRGRASVADKKIFEAECALRERGETIKELSRIYKDRNYFVTTSAAVIDGFVTSASDAILSKDEFEFGNLLNKAQKAISGLLESCPEAQKPVATRLAKKLNEAVIDRLKLTT